MVVLSLFIVLSCRRVTEVRNYESSLEQKAESAYSSDQYEECVHHYTELIFRDSTVAEFFFRRARCLSQLEDQDSLAVADFEYALIMGYDSYKCHYSLGFINLMFDRDSAAAGHFEECLKIRDDKPEVREMLQGLRSQSL